MRTLLTVVAIILLLSLLLNGWLLWDKQQTEKYKVEVSRQLQDTITWHQDRIKTAGDRINELQAKGIRTRDSVNVAQSGLKMRISALKKKVAETAPELSLSPTIFSITDTLGHSWEGSQEEFNQYLLQSLLKDEVIKAQDSLISTLELTHAAEIKDFNEILSLHQQKFAAQAEISEAWAQTAAAAQQDAKKEKRRKGFWKVTSAVLAGGILFMAVRE